MASNAQRNKEPDCHACTCCLAHPPAQPPARTQQVLPELNGRLTGMAFRVPTPNVSGACLRGPAVYVDACCGQAAHTCDGSGLRVLPHSRPNTTPHVLQWWT